MIGISLIYFSFFRRETFDHLPTWLEDVRKYVDTNTSIMLIGSKCELDHMRVVSFEEGKHFAMMNGLQFMEVSAKTTQNVNEVHIIYHHIKTN